MRTVVRLMLGGFLAAARACRGPGTEVHGGTWQPHACWAGLLEAAIHAHCAPWFTVIDRWSGVPAS